MSEFFPRPIAPPGMTCALIMVSAAEGLPGRWWREPRPDWTEREFPEWPLEWPRPKEGS